MKLWLGFGEYFIKPCWWVVILRRRGIVILIIIIITIQWGVGYGIEWRPEGVIHLGNYTIYRGRHRSDRLSVRNDFKLFQLSLFHPPPPPRCSLLPHIIVFPWLSVCLSVAISTQTLYSKSSTTIQGNDSNLSQTKWSWWSSKTELFLCLKYK